MLLQAGSNWVEGDRFFDRAADLQALERRVDNRAHTLLTAQRRMGKTSLIRELFRRFEENGKYRGVFVDLEAARNPEDAVTELAVQCWKQQSIWRHVGRVFGDLAASIDEVSVANLRIRLRSQVDAGNWAQRGDALFEILAKSDQPTVLAIDELPILVAAILKDEDFEATPERVRATEAFLGWLRKNGQAHGREVPMIVSGSAGLQPILQESGLSAYANIFSPLELKPWTAEAAQKCLGELSKTDGVLLPRSVKRETCRLLRCCVPHHVQQFYFYLYERLQRESRREATLSDVGQVYQDELLGMSGQVDLNHYETRLNLVLGQQGYRIACELLTDASVHEGMLHDESIKRLANSVTTSHGDSSQAVRFVLRMLEHDGYLARHADGYRFVSGLMQDWWRKTHGAGFVPPAVRSTGDRQMVLLK